MSDFTQKQRKEAEKITMSLQRKSQKPLSVEDNNHNFRITKPVSFAFPFIIKNGSRKTGLRNIKFS